MHDRFHDLYPNSSPAWEPKKDSNVTTSTPSWMRNRDSDAVDNRPKRKSLSLAGMSKPDREEDEGARLRRLITSTEALEKKLMNLSH